MSDTNSSTFSIDSHTLGVLEFERILEELRSLCLSKDGIKALEVQGFFTTEEGVSNSLKRVSALRGVLESGNRFPSVTFPDIEEALFKIRKGSTSIEAIEIANIAIYLQSVETLKKFLKKNLENPELLNLLDSIPDFKELTRDIFAIITREGEFKEKEIPELRGVVKRIKNLQTDIERLAYSYLRNNEYKQYWQTDIPAYKDNRLVLPLKVNFKGRIRGISHEISASGSTLFFEPYDIVDKNNHIVEAKNDYKRVIKDLLKRLSSKIAKRLDSISEVMVQVGFIDAHLAKARYSIYHNCRPANLKRGIVKLVEARHPFLGGKAIPISVAVGNTYRMLIITGPNTGGKTVTLKTIGLLSLMNQFGMEIPAEEGSVIGVFDNIFCDIGDEQSIEQSLSTFSAHVKNISHIAERATEESLVLLDELGAGTDPEEGVAIAMALLDFFYEKGCLLCATTHHGILKNYGYSKGGVENASMEFDEETLSPTYKIEIGIPGESHALEIARRNGLSKSIIERAERYIREERTDISSLIKNLSDRQRRVSALEKKQAERERFLREVQRKADLKNLQLKQKEIELREYGLKALKEYLSEARSEIERTIKELREKINSGGGLYREVVDRDIGKLRSIVGELEERVQNEENRVQKDLRELVKDKVLSITIGSRVRIRGTGRYGRVIRRERGNKWLVETDNIKVNISEYDLEPVDDAKDRESDGLKGASKPAWDFLGGSTALLEIDVRGKRLDEAIAEVEKQIDGAVLSGLREFSIIHGMGEGILQRGIREYLKSNSAVSSFRFARPEEGGFGKTVVRLKS